MLQKKLIALAIAGLSSAAFAQSNVTIYGVMDLTFENAKAGGSAAAATDLASRNRLTSNSSYIGFKGSEALGNGLTAVFQIENGIYADGTLGTSAWANRDTFLGLAGSFGTLALGNITGPTRAMGAKMDVNAGATGIGANTGLIGKLGGGAGASAFDQRIDNAIAYISPNFSGFSGVLGYSAGTSAQGGLSAREAANVGSTAQGNIAWTFGLNYDNGPIYAGYAYTTVNATNNGVAAADGIVAGVKKTFDHRAAVKYTAGDLTIGLMWDKVQNDLTAGSDSHRTAWFIPVTYQIGVGKLIAQYGQANSLSNTSNTGAKQFELGYEYSLSKRTTIKALWSQITNESGATYDFLYGSGTRANSTAVNAGNVTAGADPKGFAVGLRHTF